MSEIIPAILPKSVEELRQKLDRVPAEIPLIHVDVVDDKVFVDPVQDFECHLMVSNPDSIVDEWVEAGAKRIIVSSLSDKILKLRPGIEIGLMVELQTPLDEVYPEISKVDFLHLMSIAQIGEQGHQFEPEIFDKIKMLKQLYPGVVISIDGGVNLDNADDLLAVGVDRLVIGSAIFNAADPLDEYIKFLNVSN